MAKRYGVVGLGAMGMGIAKSLLAAKLDVWGVDLRESALEEFSKAGGKTTSFKSDAWAELDVVFLVVVNAAQMQSILFGPQGGAQYLSKGALVIGCSTVSPESAQDLASKADALGLAYIDAPISGGAAKAAQGELTVMASGPSEAFAIGQEGFDAIAAKLYVLGDRAGHGSAMKIVNQMLAGVHIAVAAEAVAFGQRMGLNAKDVYEVITNAAGNSWMFENRVPHILEDDFTPLSAVDIFVKDLGLVLESAQASKFPAPLAASAHQRFLQASAEGHGSLDDSAVIKVYPTTPFQK